MTHFAAAMLNYTYRQRQKASYACSHVYLNRDYPGASMYRVLRLETIASQKRGADGRTRAPARWNGRGSWSIKVIGLNVPLRYMQKVKS